MLPDKINIKVVELQDGEPVEVSKTFFFKFNYNAVNGFRKEKGLTLGEFAEIFGEFAVPVKDRDIDKLAKANEYFGELFYHAVKEGMRMVKLGCELTVEDCQSFLNDATEAEVIDAVAKSYRESLSLPVEDKKKLEKAAP